MDFLSELNKKKEYVNRWISELSPKGEGSHSMIFEAANYSMGGKRIRPILSAAVCEMTGNNPDLIMPFAAAVEFIHTYSLIHDDLPAMDNDDMRRGKPSCHIKYGESIAILAGDTLLNYAFETAVKAKTSAEVTLKAIDIISHASGASGMIGGQVIDINGVQNGEELIKMYNMKTGALILAAAHLGAVFSDEKTVSAVTDFAYNLGIAFQIKDDILDVEGNSKQLGKQTGSDEKSGKKTYVMYYGMQKAKADLELYTKKAKDSLAMFGEKANFLISLSDYLLSRNN